MPRSPAGTPNFPAPVVTRNAAAQGLNAGPVTGRDIEQLHARLALAGDARDLLAARDSLKQLLGLSQLDT